MCDVANSNIFFNLNKKLPLIKVIKLNKLSLMFLPVLYFNQINIFFNQINNLKKIISFIWKRLKRWFLKSNKFIFVLKVFLFRIEVKKKQFL